MREAHGLSAFALSEGVLYHTYSTYAGGLEFLLGFYPMLDPAPLGRNEGDAPGRSRHSALVGEDHRLDAIAQAELAEDALDVRLRGRRHDERSAPNETLQQQPTDSGDISEPMAQRKDRTQIPPDTADLVQFRSDRTCCVCRHPGKAYHLHHLNEDPTDHDPANLAVLCLDCHNLTQLRGGFGRHLSAGQVRLYRDQWYELVAKRRAGGEVDSYRPPTPDTGDQELLDDLLHLLSRDSVRLISQQDFVQSWPDILMSPVQVLINEYREVENEFNDPELERARIRVLETAAKFAYEEAMHGFDSDYDPRHRIAG